jgi:RNA polymerase sigma-70 factor (ECF subfamily)
MSRDFLASSSDESGAGEPRGSRAPEPPGVNEAHAERIARLFQAEYTNVVSYIAARIGSWPEARDIVAEAFAEILRKPDPETVSFLRAYIYQAARNIASNRARLGAGRKRILGIARHEFTSTTPSPEPALIKEEQLHILERALKGMRPSRRMLLRLRMWEELSFSEILAKFAAEGVVVKERTLFRWYADALEELRTAIEAAEDVNQEEGT